MGGSLIQRATRGCRAWGTLNSGSLIVTTLGWSDCDCEPYKRTFPNCGWAFAAVLRKTLGAESQEDWPFPRPLQGGVRSSELLTASLHLGTSLGELPLRWLAGEFFVFQRPLGEVDHVVPEYTPFAFCGGSVRSSGVGGLYRGVGRRPSKASLTKTIRKSA
ncbi:hypothetical protein CRG98_003650 [Punica granatum]|uniref:Uncharacterized protein n=1 Tax=Punica granatum TaxID=22663 RepID=A0A2I0L5M9_PUNGR|nr:hypothetical protein CRG98_003650 [Punica granatum]